MILTLALSATTLRAESCDSIAVAHASIGAVGLASVVNGAIAHSLMPAPGAVSPGISGKKSSIIANAGQYVPLTFPWVIKALGAPTRSSWGRMAVSQGAGALMLAATVQGCKRSIVSPRPDCTDYRSFPSGHTAWAYFGATATAVELSDLSPWYGVGTYAFAAAIGVERVVDGRHYPADVAAGAGIGITTSALGYLIGDVIFGPDATAPFEKNDNSRLSVAITTGMRFPLHSINIGPARLRFMPGLLTSVNATTALTRHFAIGATLEVTSSPVVTGNGPMAGTTLVAPLNGVALLIAPRFQVNTSRRLSVDATLSAGWAKYFSLHSAGRTIDWCSSTPVGIVEAGLSYDIGRNLSSRVSLGYEMRRYSVKTAPSETYSIGQKATQSGVEQNLRAAIAMSLKF